MTPSPASWGRRLTDQVKEVLADRRLDEALRLVGEGDGQTKSLAKEFAMMFRGLGITIRVMLPLLGSTAAVEDAPARIELIGILRRFREQMRATMSDVYDDPSIPLRPCADPVPGSVDEETAKTVSLLAESEYCFDIEQTQLAERIVSAIGRGDVDDALALIEFKERRQYVPLHDHLVRFMADAFGWVYAQFGPDELMRFHLATAEGQRRGFEKWDQLEASEFARISAFLLKQHMGTVEVREDEEKFTIEQTPCGSGGRLQVSGAYEGAHALPVVRDIGPLTLGQPSLPVYCTHCPVWNTVATLRWFGRPHWVFENAARRDGSCTLHVYKRRDGAPREYVQGFQS